MSSAPTLPRERHRPDARNAVMISFALNGFAFASWVSRIPETRHELDLSNGALGLLLLAAATGSVLTLPTTGALINRWGAALVVRAASVVGLLGLAVAALGASVFTDVATTAIGLFFYGVGIGSWDVAMNVEGAAVERRLGRTIMPRFHAGFSLGTVARRRRRRGHRRAGHADAAHLLLVVAVVLGVVQATTGRFLPRGEEVEPEEGAPVRHAAWRAWLEPRTLMIGGMVFALAVTEGTANDWLAVALIDGYGVERWVGVVGFGLFVSVDDGRPDLGNGRCSTATDGCRSCGRRCSPRSSACSSSCTAGPRRW